MVPEPAVDGEDSETTTDTDADTDSSESVETGTVRVNFGDGHRIIENVTKLGQTKGLTSGVGYGVANRPDQDDAEWLAEQAVGYEVTDAVDLGFALQDNEKVTVVDEVGESTAAPEDNEQLTQLGSELGELVQTEEAEGEQERINSLTDPRDDTEIDFYQYDDDGETIGHRMELSTDGVHIAPDDITAISEDTEWNFIGVKNGAVMFEGGALPS